MPSPIDKFQLASLECRLLSVRERAEILEAMQWAKGFDWKQIERIANFMEVFVAKKDQLIFQEGDKADFMCLIAKGQVGVFKEDSRKDQRRITSLGRGHVFGEMSLIDGEPRSASLYAKSDTVILLVMSKENFRELLEESPRSASRFCGNFHSP